MLGWIQRNPGKLVHKEFGKQPSSVYSGVEAAGSEPTHLRIISDAAYKQEAEDGYLLLGAVFLRAAGKMTQDNATSSCPVHVLDLACKPHRHVTRSTFAA